MITHNWEHQDRALSFLDNGHNGGAMLGMDMGTGKTRVAIQFIDRNKCNRVLILCPRVVLEDNLWSREFAKHSDREWYVHEVDIGKSIRVRVDKADKASALAEAMHRPFALVVNYDAAWREPFTTQLMFDRWDVAVFDESHRLKSPGGKASRFASRLKRVTQFRLALTGTPMPHSPMDLYAQWRALDTSVFGTSFQLFKSRYAVEITAEGPHGAFKKIVSYQNLKEMMDKAGEHTFVVNKRDVLDLPPVNGPEGRGEPVFVHLDPRTMKQYREFEKELVLELEFGEVTASNALVKFLRLQQITSGYVKTDDGELIELGHEKRDALSDLLEDLPQREPVVIFARFHKDLDNIREVAESQKRRYVELSGRANGLELWKRGHSEILGVQIQSGGVGIDLTRAAYGIYYSTGFSLGDFDQSLARLDRPGQTRPVTIYHLVALDTIDVKVQRALAEKKQVIDTVMAGLGSPVGTGR